MTFVVGQIPGINSQIPGVVLLNVLKSVGTVTAVLAGVVLLIGLGMRVASVVDVGVVAGVLGVVAGVLGVVDGVLVLVVLLMTFVVGQTSGNNSQIPGVVLLNVLKTVGTVAAVVLLVGLGMRTGSLVDIVLIVLETVDGALVLVLLIGSVGLNADVDLVVCDALLWTVTVVV